MDLIVRQATEWGVSLIVPLLPERSASGGRGRAEGAVNRLPRWRRIIREARQQSGSPVETVVHAPLDVKAALALHGEICRQTHLAVRSTASFLLDVPDSSDMPAPPDPLAAAGMPIALRGSFHHNLSDDTEKVVLAIGPEGGWSDSERDAFSEAGFLRVCMGRNVLRAETASLAAISALRVIVLEKESWIVKPAQA
jgi:16S rRNA (uracil1498-N3)-methyltransferase